MGLKYITITMHIVDHEDFKNKIRMLGIPQNQIAKDLGISTSMLSRWMNGKSMIPGDMCAKLDAYIDDKSRDVLKFWESSIRERILTELGHEYLTQLEEGGK